MAFTLNPGIPYDPANPRPQSGKHRVLFFRRLKDAQNEDAFKLAFQTEHSRTVANDTSSTPTKDGPINSAAGATVEVPFTAILAKNDPYTARLEEAVYDSDVIECWDVVIDEDMRDENGKYLATYMQGLLNSWEETMNSEENIQLSTTLVVNGRPQKGYLPLNAQMKEAAQYAFRTLAKYTDDESAPDAPTVDPVTSLDDFIEGTAEAGAIVTARNDDTKAILGSTTAESTGGAFMIEIEPQAPGTSIAVVAKDAAGNVSPPTVVTVA